VEHLLELGHTRLALLAAAPDNAYSMWRERLFSRLCRERGLEIELGSIVHGDWWNPAVNAEAAKRLLALTPRPTGVICNGDPAAAVLLTTAHASGISVPQQLSVVGYGDYSFSVFSDPPLTTVAQPFRELGRLAVDRLLDRIINSSQDWDDLDRTTLPSTLMVRDSTGIAPSD
jgi:LacI family repressor for deo operon, udp, cdd, tsx, nupC, and nupG